MVIQAVRFSRHEKQGWDVVFDQPVAPLSGFDFCTADTGTPAKRAAMAGAAYLQPGDTMTAPILTAAGKAPLGGRRNRILAA